MDGPLRYAASLWLTKATLLFSKVMVLKKGGLLKMDLIFSLKGNLSKLPQDCTLRSCFECPHLFIGMGAFNGEMGLLSISNVFH